jgi:hypothetical protein
MTNQNVVNVDGQPIALRQILCSQNNKIQCDPSKGQFNFSAHIPTITQMHMVYIIIIEK